MADLGSDAGQGALNLSSKVLELLMKILDRLYQSWLERGRREVTKQQLAEELQYCATQVHKHDGQRLPVPCRFILDEFANTCTIPNFVTSALSVGNYQSLGGMMSGEVQTQLNNVTGLGNVLGLFISTMLVALAIKICGLLIQVIAFGRMFELYIYLAVSPLPCAFFPLGDGTGGGWSRITQKFFKSFIAVCLQGVMIILCIRIFYMIIGNSIDAMILNATGGTDAGAIVTELCYTMLMGAIVLVMSVARCGSWAKSIIDAM